MNTIENTSELKSEKYMSATVVTKKDLASLNFTETSDPYDSYVYRAHEVQVCTKTSFQNVLICDTYNFGRVLVLDGAIQSSEDDEALYHETLVQPAMLAHEKPQDILIIGGGEGATLREVLVHRSVRSVTMVDIDGEVVDLCKKHLASWHRGAFDDKRAHVIHTDGRKFIEDDASTYDVVIIDVVDMLDNGPAQALYTTQFYSALKKRLNPGAIVVVQGMEFSFLDDQPHAALVRTLKTVFPEVHSYSETIPSFLSAWGFILASDWFSPDAMTADEFDERIDDRLGDYLEHVDGQFIKGRFEMSKLTRERIYNTDGPVLEDGKNFLVIEESKTGDEKEDLIFPYKKF